MTDTTTMPDVIAYIAARATTEDIDIIFGAAKIRHRHLAAQRAATVGLGDTVTLTNLTPKALNGLTGVVQGIRGQRADVLLDAGATKVLAASRTKFALSAMSVEKYLVRGVPLTACVTR